MPVFKQDMPPSGGYKPINIQRAPAKSFFGGYTLFGAYLGITAGACYLYALNVMSVRKRELEKKGASLAIYPMLMAERDRAYLKQLRKNREEERELMKNVEGWKVGTWYGEPIYVGKDPDFLVEPKFQEYFVHAKYSDIATRAEISLVS